MGANSDLLGIDRSADTVLCGQNCLAMLRSIRKFVSKAFVLFVIFNTVSYGGIFDYRTSTSTDFIEADIGGGKYHIPRNYIFQMDNWDGGREAVVTLRVVYPGLTPYSEKNIDCFAGKISCRVYEIVLLDNFTTSEEQFQNLGPGLKIIRNASSPYGFELWTVGPESARIEFYKKLVDGHSFVFDCDVSENNGVRDGVCHHVARTDSGSTISYFFNRNVDLKNALNLDKAFRALVDSFSDINK